MGWAEVLFSEANKSLTFVSKASPRHKRRANSQHHQGARRFMGSFVEIA
jgi:hypothetical protein